MVRFCTGHSFTHVVRALAACAVMMCGSAAWGVSYRWITAGTGDWSIATNWQKDNGSGTYDTATAAPVTGDTVYVNVKDEDSSSGTASGNGTESSSIIINLTGDVSVGTLSLETTDTHSITINLNGHTLSTTLFVLGNIDDTAH